MIVANATNATASGKLIGRVRAATLGKAGETENIKVLLLLAETNYYFMGQYHLTLLVNIQKFFFV
jgi:hypothetical protein